MYGPSEYGPVIRRVLGLFLEAEDRSVTPEEIAFAGRRHVSKARQLVYQLNRSLSRKGHGRVVRRGAQYRLEDYTGPARTQAHPRADD